MDDQAWAAFRKRIRTRARCQMALFVCPFGIVVALLTAIQPGDYAPGDIRASVAYRVVFSGLIIVVMVIVLVTSVRWLLADRRGSK